MRYCWSLWIAVLILAGCTPNSLPPQPINQQTARALTPEPTATSAPTSTIAPTATATTAPTSTVPPESTATTTATAEAQAPATDVSYCRRPFGPADGARFSARLDSVRTSQTDQFEQVTFVFTDTVGDLRGTASCMLASGWPKDMNLGTTQTPGAAVIAVSLDDWAHDDLFAASPLTQTAEITPSGVLQRVAFAADSLASRGAVLGIGLREPRPFRVRIEGNRLIVEVARNASYPPAEDPLGQAASPPPPPQQPLFFLQNGDVWRYANGAASVVTKTADLETGMAVSPDGTMLAVCRAPADAEPFALPYDVRATLWTMRADGTDAQQLADVGGCAEPAFAASGKTIAFTANVAPNPPAVLQVFTVPVIGGEATPVTVGLDEWSRSQPQWLADGRLIYRASNGSGQTILDVRDVDGAEREISGQLLTGPTYRGVGQFVVDAANNQIAVEALRSADDGADLVVLRVDGTQVAAEKRGFWQRPLAFSSTGLIYLTVECPSESLLTYTIHRRTAQGTIETLASGRTATDFGAVAAVGDNLLYVRTVTNRSGLRGPLTRSELDTASSIWMMTADGSGRAELYAAPLPITGLRSAQP